MTRTHDQTRSGSNSLAGLPIDPAPEFAKWRPKDGMTPRDGSSAHLPAEGPCTTPGISEAHVRFLRAVIDQPGEPSSTYPKLAGLGAKRAQIVRNELIERGYLRSHRVSTGGRGRAAMVLEPLEAAFRIATSRGAEGSA